MLMIIISPISPEHMDWSSYYPAYTLPDPEVNPEDSAPTEATPKAIRKLRKDIEVADIGCGFGGLLVALAPKLPDTLLLGLSTYNHIATTLTL